MKCPCKWLRWVEGKWESLPPRHWACTGSLLNTCNPSPEATDKFQWPHQKFRELLSKSHRFTGLPKTCRQKNETIPSQLTPTQIIDMRQLAASRHPAHCLGSNTCFWASQMWSCHASGATSLLRHMSACLEIPTQASVFRQMGFWSRSLAHPQILHFGSLHKVILGRFKAGAPFRWSQTNTYQSIPNTRHVPTSNSKNWRVELIQRKTHPEMPTALTLPSQHHPIYPAEPLTVLSDTQSQNTLSWKEPILRATPATLCSHLSDCFHLLLLPGVSVISPHRQFLSLYCLQLQQLSKQGLPSPCPRCLNKTKLIHCSFYCFQICFLQMFPPFHQEPLYFSFSCRNY